MWLATVSITFFAVLLQPSNEWVIKDFFSDIGSMIANPVDTASSFGEAADGILKGIKEVSTSSDATAIIGGRKQPVSYRFKTDGDHKMAEVFYATVDGKEKIIDCYLYGDKVMIKYALKFIPSSMVDNVDQDEMRNIIDECSNLYDPNNNGTIHITSGGIPVYSQVRRLFQYLVIFPGTKWCGAGDVASNYDDLGPARETDMCCRHHDHCNRSIAAFSSNEHGLNNKGFYTKSHCDCDEAFHKCLTESKQFVSFTVGKMFFDLLKTQCFRKDFPVTRCKKTRRLRIPLLQGNCLEYEKDRRKPKLWQFFDAPGFESYINLISGGSNSSSEVDDTSTDQNYNSNDKSNDYETTTKRSGIFSALNPFG